MVCPACGGENTSGAEQCIHCSQSLPKRETGMIADHPELKFIPGDMIGSRYRVIELIGEGGMGKVFKAMDLEIGRPVVLKMIRPEFSSHPDMIDRFRRELIMAREISNDHIVRLHDLGEAAGLRFITMNFIEGSTLEEILGQVGTISPAKTVAIGLQICSALAAAHRKGIIHRDLKPQNIMIDPRGTVCILDFGIARSEHGDNGITATGLNIGTPRFMAPEQFQGEPASPRSDIFSLGMILYEMITGRLPFPQEGDAPLFHPPGYRPIIPLRQIYPGLPRALAETIEKCLESDPRHRFAAAEKVEKALLRIQGRMDSGAARMGRLRRLFCKPIPVPWLDRPLRVLEWLIGAAILIGAGIVVRERIDQQKAGALTRIPADFHDMKFPLAKTDIPDTWSLRPGNALEIYHHSLPDRVSLSRFRSRMAFLRLRMTTVDLVRIGSIVERYRRLYSIERCMDGVWLNRLDVPADFPIPADFVIGVQDWLFLKTGIDIERGEREPARLLFLRWGYVLLDLLRSAPDLPAHLNRLAAFYTYFQDLTALLLTETGPTVAWEEGQLAPLIRGFLNSADGPILARLIHFQQLGMADRFLEDGVSPQISGWIQALITPKHWIQRYLKESRHIHRQTAGLFDRNEWTAIMAKTAISGSPPLAFPVADMVDLLYAARTAARFTLVWNRWQASIKDAAAVSALQKSTGFVNEFSRYPFVWKVSGLDEWSLGLSGGDPTVLQSSPLFPGSQAVARLFQRMAPRLDRKLPLRIRLLEP